MVKPTDARSWLAVVRDATLIALGVFIVVYTLVWGSPPKASILLAGIGLVIGGSRHQLVDLLRDD